jgi:MFS family permease
LTATAGWRWVFLINVPATLLAALATRAVVNESKAEKASKQLDWAGALLVTGGLTLIIGGISQVEHATSFPAGIVRVAAPLAIGCVLLTGFVLAERRAVAPLVPRGQFGADGQLAANLVGLVLPVGLGAALFLATLYLQRVQGLGPMTTGAVYLALAVPCIAASPLASHLATRVGRQITAMAGLLLQVAGLLILTRLSLDSGLAGVLTGFVLIGLGAPMAFVPTTASAMDGPSSDPGLASGLFNTSQQLGNAIAIAAIATLAAAVQGHLGESPAGLTKSYNAGFMLAAGIALVGAIPTLRLNAAPRQGRDRPQSPESPSATTS